MQRTHYGNIEQQDASTLYHINFWGRKNIPADHAAFQVLEELVCHGFDFREVLLKWKKKVELHKLKVLRLDNAGEFKAIEDELILISLARAMLIDAQLPINL